MFDFRYHAFSLVAVFLALTIGLLLGVAIGDEGLVSSAEHDLRSSLRTDVEQAHDQSDALRTQLHEHERFEQEAYPIMVGGRLQGMRVGLVAFGELNDGLVKQVRSALSPTGAHLVSVMVIREQPNLKELAEKAGSTYAGVIEQQPVVIERLGRRIGGQIAGGGKLIDQTRRTLFSSSSGEFSDLQAVVLFHASDKPKEKNAALVQSQFEQGLILGLRRHGMPTLGVEQTTTDPSQVSWYEEHELGSVDNLDQVSGWLALVLALAGAEGSYGIKSSADALLPRAVVP